MSLNDAQVMRMALDALGAVAFAHPSANDQLGQQCEAAETAIRAALAIQRPAEPDGDFKNFHRALCERFGYSHDQRDWKRDQVSLIEHIAKLTAHPTAGH